MKKIELIITYRQTSKEFLVIEYRVNGRNHPKCGKYFQVVWLK